MMRLLIILFCTFAGIGTANVDKITNQVKPSGGLREGDQRCGLKCFLKKVIFYVPNVQKKVLFSTLYLTDIKCGNLELNDISSSFKPPITLSIKEIGIGVTCSLNYTWGFFGGTAQTTASKSSLSGDIEFIENPETNLTNIAKLSNGKVNIDITNVEFSGSFMNSSLIKSTVKFLLNEELPGVILKAITGFIDVNLSGLLQSINKVIYPYLEGYPPDLLIPKYDQSKLMNFTNNPLIIFLDYALNNIVGVDGPLSLNSIANHYSNGTGHMDFTNLKGWNMTFTNRSPRSEITVGISNMSISGMNTFTIVGMMKPIRSFFLSNMLELSDLKANVSFYVKTVLLEEDVFKGGRGVLYEEGDLQFSLTDLSAKLVDFLAINKLEANELTLSQLMNIGCYKKAIISTNITQLLLNFDLNYIKVLANDKGININDNSDKNLELDIDKFIDNILQLFIKSYKHAVPGFVDGFVAGPVANRINKIVSEFMNIPVTNLDVNDINAINVNDINVCPPKRKEPDYWDLSEGGSIIGFTAAFIIWLFICICIHIYVKNSKNNNNDDNDDTNNDNTNGNNDSNDDNNDNYDNNNVETQRLILKVEHSSLIMSENLPIYIRYGIPLYLLLNIALFISSNTSVGASVYLVLDIGGHELKSHTLFNFTLISSIKDMWNAGVYALALLIAVFSGIWPYIKLVAMMLCWMMPHIILSIRGREKVLMFLDAMGKWSLIDAFILVFMMVVFSFKVEVPPPHSNSSVDNITTITTYVVPQMGFHSFVLATIASLVITHIILVFHRRVSIRELSVFANENHLSDRTFYAYNPCR